MSLMTEILNLDELVGEDLTVGDPPASKTLKATMFGREWTFLREVPLIADLAMATTGDLTADDITTYLEAMVVPSQRTDWLRQWSLMPGDAVEVMGRMEAVRSALNEAVKAKPAAKRAAARKKVAAKKKTAGSARRR